MTEYLDDLRPAPAGWICAYWPDEVIELLQTGGVKTLSLDHDLGEDKHGTGYDVIRYIEDVVVLHGFNQPPIRVHSADPVASRRMLDGMKAITQYKDGTVSRKQDIIRPVEVSRNGRKELMEDLELLSRLKTYSTFGISMVQRITGFGYQRTVDTLDRLEAEGAILKEPGSSEWQLDSTRSALRALYEEHKAALLALENLPCEGVEPLILMDVPKGWSKASKRVLVVGQETTWWDFKPGDYYDWPFPPVTKLEEFLEFSGSVEALMYGYGAFDFARHQREFNSPFWRAYRQIRLSVGDEPLGFDTRVLYTNLFKTAVHGSSIVKEGTVEDADDVWRASAGLLTRELEILRPDVVIFFTGPDYDRYIELEFPGMAWIAAGDCPQREYALLFHPSLPPKTVRTYHPNYLVRSRNWHMIDEVCALAV